MAVTRPYRRIIRQFADGDYAEGGRWMYIRHPKYATDPAHFIRSFLMIQRDLQSLLDFIEPADTNLQTYSFRIHQLLMATCMEIEANFKAIFFDNGCDLGSKGNIKTYEQVGKSHQLSGYEIKLPLWRERTMILRPFRNWPNAIGKGPSWYQAYNNLKHNRHENFAQANLENLLNAIAGLAILLTAQFQHEAFSSGPDFLSISLEADTGGFESCIGDYFTVRYPTDWPENERYDFDWRQFKSEKDPFVNYPYRGLEKRCHQKKET
ncbi:hypothetical protein [Pedomonas mirosovicensis]|uniref:hypothetical protein n=1 Tax=Pedomonas mirosovicensis TaxID=2908641 RepID=UPI0021696938|nr:hypothetical protein [Pedomonas mirosovicensis]MCH8684271.1 hypothetical protein [Pedomonas mirosovicensis]